MILMTALIIVVVLALIFNFLHFLITPLGLILFFCALAILVVLDLDLKK